MARITLHTNSPDWAAQADIFSTDKYNKAQKYAKDAIARGYKVWIRKRPAVFYRGTAYTVFYTWAGGK